MNKIDKNNKLIMLVLCGLLWFFMMPGHNACGLVLTFDDLAGSMQQDLDMPATYHGFSWQNVNVLHPSKSFSRCSFSGFGASYADVSLVNDAGTAMDISRDETFSWLGATFSALDSQSGQITIEGYINGILSFSTTLLLNESCPYDLKVNWSVDELVIRASGDNLLDHFTMDDFRYSLGRTSLLGCRCSCNGTSYHGGSSGGSGGGGSGGGVDGGSGPGGGGGSGSGGPGGGGGVAPVPEPSTVLLMGFGMAAMGLMRLRKKRG